MYPLVKIHGGGYYNKDFVISHFPENYESLSYLETCVGGGSIILNKKPSVRECICDIDPDLISIYEYVRDNLEWFQFALGEIEHSQEAFNKALSKMYAQPINEYILRRMSLSGRMKTYAKSERLRGGVPEGVNAWNNSIKALTQIHQRLKDVSISNRSILISLWSTAYEFYYLDPPFLPETRQSKDIYTFEMTREDHEAMIDSVIGRAHTAKFLIAGYASDLYRELELNGFSRHDKELTNHSSQAKTKSKKILSVWKNY